MSMATTSNSTSFKQVRENLNRSDAEKTIGVMHREILHRVKYVKHKVKLITQP